MGHSSSVAVPVVDVEYPVSWVTVTVTVKKPPQQRHENPPQNPTKRVLQLDQAVRYVNVLKPRATVQQNGERRGSWLEQPPSAAPR